MPQLVAIDLPGGPAFVEALQRVWDRGDAVFPVDRRLPPAARGELLAAIRPTRMIDVAGERRLDGDGTEPGDALVMATSGSTGAPKGVVLTHDAVTASARATSDRLAITEADTWLACLPLAHVGGLGVVTRAVLTGTRLIVHDGFDPAAAAAAGATAVALVATALRRVDPAIFRIVVLGGARPPADLADNVVTTYGLTESGGGVVYDRSPLPGVEVRIAADGEVLLRAPMLTRGYRDGTSPVDSSGWLHTGDLGRLDNEGRLHVAGRRTEMIITGGENVWPEQVERALASLPGIADVAVTGVADDEWGQRIVAWIVPIGEPPSLVAVRDHVAETLPRFAAPREVRIIAAIPRTALGKIARHKLLSPRPPAGKR